MAREYEWSIRPIVILGGGGPAHLRIEERRGCVWS